MVFFPVFLCKNRLIWFSVPKLKTKQNQTKSNRNNTLYIHIISFLILIFTKLSFVPIQTLIPFHCHGLSFSRHNLARCVFIPSLHISKTISLSYLTASPLSQLAHLPSSSLQVQWWSSSFWGFKFFLSSLHLLFDCTTSFTVRGAGSAMRFNCGSIMRPQSVVC